MMSAVLLVAMATPGQCLPAEEIVYPVTIQTKKYVQVKMPDGRYIDMPVINGYLPECTEYKDQFGTVVKRRFTYTSGVRYTGGTPVYQDNNTKKPQPPPPPKVEEKRQEMPVPKKIEEAPRPKKVEEVPKPKPADSEPKRDPLTVPSTKDLSEAKKSIERAIAAVEEIKRRLEQAKRDEKAKVDIEKLERRLAEKEQALKKAESKIIEYERLAKEKEEADRQRGLRRPSQVPDQESGWPSLLTYGERAA